MDRHKAVKKLNKNSETDLEEDLTVCDIFFAYHKTFICMLENFERMWNRLFCSIKAVKHRIKLQKIDERPLQSALFRAGPKARGIENQTVDWMLVMGFIVPARTEWVFPIIFETKTERFHSVRML